MVKDIERRDEELMRQMVQATKAMVKALDKLEVALKDRTTKQRGEQKWTEK